MKTRSAKTILVALAVVLTFSLVMRGGESTAPRRIPEGALTPAFSAVDVTGKLFSYTRSSGKVLILAFLSAEKKTSQEAVEDLVAVVSSLPPDRLNALQVAFVLQDVDNSEFIALIQQATPLAVHILDDDRYRVWGTFGIIATPTVLIGDSQGKVLCVRSGHAHDFAPVLKAALFQALDIPYEVSPADAATVRTVANTTLSAKARRHLQMAKLLSQKGKVISAIEQARMAYEIDPNVAEVTLELGELLCRAGQAQQAFKLAQAASVQSLRDKARVNLTLGWASRQMGRMEQAEAFLQEGIRQDATLPRLHFELGRIHQQRNDSEKAMRTYFQALKLIYHEEEQ